MWKYTELDAYNSISLHDCSADSVEFNGTDLIFDFADGFWVLPVSSHNGHDKPVKTGHAQLCFHGVFKDEPFDAIDVYKTTHIFTKPIFCRRLQPEYADFLEMFKTGKYELEFITEYHAHISSLYQCWIWKKGIGLDAECQLEITAKNIEYRWNEILYDHEW